MSMVRVALPVTRAQAANPFAGATRWLTPPCFVFSYLIKVTVTSYTLSMRVACI